MKPTIKLRPQDRVSIVVYAGAAGLVLDAAPGNQKATITGGKKRINIPIGTSTRSKGQINATVGKESNDGLWVTRTWLVPSSLMR